MPENVDFIFNKGNKNVCIILERNSEILIKNTSKISLNNIINLKKNCFNLFLLFTK